MSKEFIKEDPELYKRLCEPYPSLDSVNDSLKNFFEEFRSLREKYGIPDVVIIARAIFKDQGILRDELITMNCGDSKLVFPMVLDVYEKQRDAFIIGSGLVGIPGEMFDRSDFFTSFLLHIKVAKNLDDAKQLIHSGRLHMNGKVLLTDGSAPDDDFTLTFNSQSIKIPGKKSKDKNQIPK